MLCPKQVCGRSTPTPGQSPRTFCAANSKCKRRRILVWQKPNCEENLAIVFSTRVSIVATSLKKQLILYEIFWAKKGERCHFWKQCTARMSGRRHCIIFGDCSRLCRGAYGRRRHTFPEQVFQRCVPNGGPGYCQRWTSPKSSTNLWRLCTSS